MMDNDVTKNNANPIGLALTGKKLCRASGLETFYTILPSLAQVLPKWTPAVRSVTKTVVGIERINGPTPVCLDGNDPSGFVIRKNEYGCPSALPESGDYMVERFRR